ncbi:MAG: hypothetical protein ACE5JA_08090 [bacterium]
MQSSFGLAVASWLFCIAFSLPVFPQDVQTAEEKDVDWTKPESIDLFSEGIGDFLDIDLTAYQKKAYEAYNSTDYETAARYNLAFLRYNVRDANSIYNLACCYGLLGKASLAAKYLERAVRAGFGDIEHMRGDPDFDKVRGRRIFDETVDSIALRIEGKEKLAGKVLHVGAPALFKCRIRLPENYDSTLTYPLVVALHGLGSNPDRFITLWEKMGEPELIFASPQAPYAFSVGGGVGYSWGIRVSGDEELWEKASAMTEEYIVEAVQNLSKHYKADRVYLLGFSQGCAFAYGAGVKHHSLFDGLICFGGWLDTDWLTEEAVRAARGLKVFIAHGKDDRVVKYEEGIKAKEILENHGWSVTFRDFRGGHRVPAEAARQAAEWIRTQ